MRWVLLVGIAIAAACGAAAPAGAAVLSGPVDLSVAGHAADRPQVAVAADGAAIAAWRRSNGSDRMVQAATRPPGGAWAAPDTVSTGGADAEEPRLAVDPGGDAALVWHRLDPAGTIAQASYRPAGASWEAPFTLSAPGREAHGASVALDAAGGATAVWLSFDGQRQIVEARYRAPGGAWGGIEQVSGPAANAYAAVVGAGPAGTAIAVWQRSDGAYARIETATRAPDGSWSPPVRLSAPGRHASAPRVAVAPDGTVVVAWQRFNGVNTIVQATRRAPGGNWPAPSDLSRAGLSAHGPSLALDAAGTALVTWADPRGIHAALRTATGGEWSTAQQLAFAGRTPQVAAGAAGVFAVTYALYDTVYGALRKDDGTWHRERLSDFAAQSFYPDAAVVGEYALVVWQRLGDRADLVQTAAFDSAVPPEEDEVTDDEDDEEIGEDGEETDGAAADLAAVRIGTARVVGARVVIRMAACARCSGTLALRSLLPGRAARTGALIAVTRFTARRGSAVVHLRLSPRHAELLTRVGRLPAQVRVGAQVWRVILRR